jgi:hypothetical protein
MSAPEKAPVVSEARMARGSMICSWCTCKVHQ